MVVFMTLSALRSQPDSERPLVLVVDDEVMVNELLVAALQFNGFAVCSAATGTEALRSVEQDRPHLVVLDVNLPDFDGFEVCRRMRAYGHDMPVVFLTALNESTAIRTGFERGGDDYLTKPFRIDELVLRITAILRRTRPGGTDGRMVCADLELNERAVTVTRQGSPINLSPTEFRLLSYLLRNQGVVVSKAQILLEVWNDDGTGADSTLVETYVGYLRRKVDHVGAPLIHTVRGSGYVIRPPSLMGDAR
jgi:two-component system, OmpR family, response regulator